MNYARLSNLVGIPLPFALKHMDFRECYLVDFRMTKSVLVLNVGRCLHRAVILKKSEYLHLYGEPSVSLKDKKDLVFTGLDPRIFPAFFSP